MEMFKIDDSCSDAAIQQLFHGERKHLISLAQYNGMLPEGQIATIAVNVVSDAYPPAAVMGELSQIMQYVAASYLLARCPKNFNYSRCIDNFFKAIEGFSE